MELPYGTIADAMAAATPGTVIALSKGTFDEEVELETGVTLWGACVAETLVTCSIASPTRPTVWITGADTGLRNLRVSGERAGITLLGARYSLEAESIVVAGARSAGLDVNGGRAVFRNVVVRDTRADASGGWGLGLTAAAGAEVEMATAVFERNRMAGFWVDRASVRIADAVVCDTQGLATDDSYGLGLAVWNGSQFEATRFAVERNTLFGLMIDDGGSVKLEDAVVRDTMAQGSDLDFGQGVGAFGGAQVELNRVVFERNHRMGVLADEAGTMIVARDIVVRDTNPAEHDDAAGDGVVISNGAGLDLVRALLERNWHVGIAVWGSGTIARLSDVIVRDIQSEIASGTGGLGLAVDSGAIGEANRIVIERCRAHGVLSRDSGTVLTLNDLVVRDTRSMEADGFFGEGLAVSSGARLELHGGLFEGNREIGVAIESPGTSVLMSDVVIRDTMCRERDGNGGRGLEVDRGASIEASRMLIERNRAAGAAFFDQGTIAQLNDLVIRDTSSQQSDGNYGFGAYVDGGASISASQIVIESNQVVGVAAFNEATELSLADLLIRETVGRAFDGLGGTGLSVLAGAHIEAVRFSVIGNALCGLQLAHGEVCREEGLELVDCHMSAAGGEMDLREGTISDNEVCGINVQTEGFDVERLRDRVIFRDNGIELDMSGDIYVPEIVVPGLDP